MKILHVIPSAGPLNGGPSQSLRSVAKALRNEGLSVDVATTDGNGRGRSPVSLGRPNEENGINFWYFRRQNQFYTFSWPLLKWLQENITNYDIVHVHALFSFSSTIAGSLAIRRSVPYVLRPLGTLNRWGMENRRPWLKQLSLKLIERRLLKQAAFVHFTTEDEKRQASDLRYPFRSVVIPNIVTLDPEPISFKSATVHFEILFLSRIDRIKGLDLLIEALPEIKKEIANVRLTIAGSGDPALRNALQQKSRSHGIEDSIRWLDFIEGRQKRQLMADSDIFVLPSYSENFGLAAVEAMGAGLPVVVTEGVGVHTFVTAGEAGIVVRPDVTQIASAIISLCRNPQLRRTMSKNGPKIVRESFSSQAVARSLIACYREAIHHSAAGSL